MEFDPTSCPIGVKVLERSRALERRVDDMEREVESWGKEVRCLREDLLTQQADLTKAVSEAVGHVVEERLGNGAARIEADLWTKKNVAIAIVLLLAGTSLGEYLPDLIAVIPKFFQ